MMRLIVVSAIAMIRPYHSGDNDNVAMIISYLCITYDNIAVHVVMLATN